MIKRRKKISAGEHGQMRYRFTTIIAIIFLSAVGVVIAVGLLNFSAIGLLIPSVVWGFLGRTFGYILLWSPVISFVARPEKTF